MRRKKFLPALFCVFAFLFLCFPPAVKAEEADFEKELLEKSGADELYENLDGEAKELLDQAGIHGVMGSDGAGDLFSVLSGLLREKLFAPLKAVAALSAVILLCRLASCFGSGEISDTVSFAGALACAMIVVTPLLTVIRATQRAVESASAFLLASVPVYGALMVASGSPTAGTSYSFLTLSVGNAIPILSSAVVFPVLHLFLALTLASSVSRIKFGGLAESLYSFAKWLLVLAVTVFSAVLSVQTVLNAQVDAASNKAAKLLASSAIPIVGGAFGDAVAAIQNSVRIVKSGAGAFGILAAVCIFAPPAIEAALWVAVCFAGRLTGDLFETPGISAFLGRCASAAKMILAVIAATCAVSVVSAAIILFVREGL